MNQGRIKNKYPAIVGFSFFGAHLTINSYKLDCVPVKSPFNTFHISLHYTNRSIVSKNLMEQRVWLLNFRSKIYIIVIAFKAFSSLISLRHIIFIVEELYDIIYPSVKSLLKSFGTSRAQGYNHYFGC